MPFNIDQAIADWRKNLRKYRSFEPGFIDELQSNLEDRYDEYLIRGLSPERAFAEATQKVMPNPGKTSRAMAQANSPYPWYSLRGHSFLFLLPNYIKVALRNLRRRRFYNLINYVCLTVGILTTALAALYLRYETSFDTMVPDSEQKYRLGRTFRSQDYSVMSFDGYFGATPEQQMQQINGFRNVKGVAQACQFYTFWQPTIIRAQDKELTTDNILETNTPGDFFDFFGWPFIYGSVDGFRENLYSAVLTETQAERFFGPDWRHQNLRDQTLRIDEQDYSISGVMEDLPANAHYDFSIALHKEKIEYWGSRTYVKLSQGADPEEVAKRMNAAMGSISPRMGESELFGGTIIQPLTSIHLNSDMLYELKPPGDKRYLYIIGFISAIILLLTISNYTNLSIAMNAGRTREIGMRKLFGASHRQISSQFVLESLVLSILSLPLVALGLWLLIPWFNNFMGTGLEEQILQNGFFWLVLIGVGIGVGLLASLYPSLYLAQHPIVRLFKGNLAQNRVKGWSTRKAIITFQFILLIGLCSLTLFVNQQLRYIQEKDLGFDKEQVVYVNLSQDSSKYEVFKNELEKIPEVTGVGWGSPLGRNPFNQTTYKLAGKSDVFDDAHDIALDYNSIDLLNIKTSIGDYVANPAEAPERVILINETLADKLTNFYDIPRTDLIGRTIIEEPEYTDEETGETGFPFTIAGTFEDINMFSLREKVEPMFLTVIRDPSYVQWVAVAWEGIGPSAIVDKIKETYSSLQLDQAFYHSYLTQNIEELYEKERRIARLSIYFSLVAFAVAVIGLVALTAYLTTLKRKEIGIRKILGASHLDIVKRFNREYLWLLAIGLLIAAPLTWLGVAEWLSTFAYRITISPLIFLAAGGITLLIASVAVSLMTLRAANAVPVEALQENQ